MPYSSVYSIFGFCYLECNFRSCVAGPGAITGVTMLVESEAHRAHPRAAEKYLSD